MTDRLLLLIFLIGCGGGHAPEILSTEEAEALQALGYMAEPEPLEAQMLTLRVTQRPELLEADPGMALAFNDPEDTDVEPPTKPNDVIRKMADAEGTKEHIEVAEEAIKENIEETENLNKDLADILAKIREKKGLPKVNPYQAPNDLQQLPAPQESLGPVFVNNEIPNESPLPLVMAEEETHAAAEEDPGGVLDLEDDELIVAPMPIPDMAGSPNLQPLDE